MSIPSVYCEVHIILIYSYYVSFGKKLGHSKWISLSRVATIGFAVTAPWTHLQGIFLGMVLG